MPIYTIYMIIVGKSLPIDNYEQYKRVINQITGRLYMHIYILETKKLFERERERGGPLLLVRTRRWTLYRVTL